MAKSFWWVVTEAQEVSFEHGEQTAVENTWFFPKLGYVETSSLFDSEKAAVKECKIRIRKYIQHYKDKLDKLNKRGV